MSKYTEFNVNHHVKVRLTQAGRDEIARQRRELFSTFPTLKEDHSELPPVDEDGYTEFQMWSLMNELGHMCGLTLAAPFFLDILIEDRT